MKETALAQASAAAPMFELCGVTKAYAGAVALGPLTVRIGGGEIVAVIGPSGSGKTTLLHLLGCILPPDRGELRIAGRPASVLRPGRELARLVGVMHQHFDLVPNLAVVHNVLAGRLGEWSLLRSLVSLVVPQEVERARAALERLGVAHKLYERTSRLSGGEQQRVALARLLVQSPRAILADEPVSALDPARAEDLLAMLVAIARERGHTLVASLHSVEYLRHFDRVVALRSGRVAFDRPRAAVTETDLTRLYALEEGGARCAPGAAASRAAGC